MAPRNLLTIGVALALGCLLGVPLNAGLFDPVSYELLPGSLIIEDCFCDHLPIERPLAGSFILTRLPVRVQGEMYSLTGIDFAFTGSDVDFRFKVKGSGTLHRTGESLFKQSMNLDLEVNGTGGIRLQGGPLESGAEWPALDITVKEDGSRDPFRIYSIRMVAAPRAGSVLYELVEGDFPTFKGSFFIDDCTICGRPTIPLPVAGTFFLRKTGGGGPNPITTYAVESLDLQAAREGPDYRIQGGGTYQEGGEVALLQSMELTVSVNDDRGVLLAGGPVSFPPGVRFPEIEIELSHQNPASQLHVYSLHVVARPVEPPPPEFRRGDSNGDGREDISDAIHIFSWRFGGGPEPECLEAADADADGRHDLTDAVYLLLHLFQGGSEPPAPGPTTCGPAKSMVFGCLSYPACGV